MGKHYRLFGNSKIGEEDLNTVINYMTVRNSYQIVKVSNSLCVSAPLREIELAKSQSRKEKKRMNQA